MMKVPPAVSRRPGAGGIEATEKREKSYLTALIDSCMLLKTDDEGEKLRNGRTANRGWWEPGGHSADMKASEGGVNKSEGTGPPGLDFSSNRRIAGVIGQRV